MGIKRPLLPLILAAALLYVAASSSSSQELVGFSSGPYTHQYITHLALERFAEESGWEVAPLCAANLIQSSVSSDSNRRERIDLYHCDNDNLPGCSHNYDRYRRRARNTFSPQQSLFYIGISFHVIQDFYAHSNWVEIFRHSMILAPIEAFKDIPPPPDLQTGIFPDHYSFSIDDHLNCYNIPEDLWGSYIPNAPHNCLNKDSNRTFRGMTPVSETPWITYHELAAEYAIRHTVKALHYHRKTTPHFQSCLRPTAISQGCNAFSYRYFH